MTLKLLCLDESKPSQLDKEKHVSGECNIQIHATYKRSSMRSDGLLACSNKANNSLQNFCSARQKLKNQQNGKGTASKAKHKKRDCLSQPGWKRLSKKVVNEMNSKQFLRKEREKL